jgi:hypothetical protein
MMFSNINEVWNNDPVKAITDNLAKNDTANLSDSHSLHLLSDEYNINNYGSYAPVNFGKKDMKIMDLEMMSEMISSPVNSKCFYSMKHLKKCDKCHYKLKALINSKVNKKFDEMILKSKMKQLQNATAHTQPYVPKSDSWKETLIIVVGAIIAIFIIFILVKSLNK